MIMNFKSLKKYLFNKFFNINNNFLEIFITGLTKLNSLM